MLNHPLQGTDLVLQQRAAALGPAGADPHPGLAAPSWDSLQHTDVSSRSGEAAETRQSCGAQLVTCFCADSREVSELL